MQILLTFNCFKPMVFSEADENDCNIKKGVRALKIAVFAVGRFIKKHWIVFLILGLLLYLIAGALAPFMHYQSVSPEFKESFSKEKLLEPEASPDRAMLVETNTSAWEERIRLMDLARERIILSTFDMRDGESTRDLLSVLLHKADEGVSVKILVDGFSGFLRMEGKPLFYVLSSHPNVEIRIYNPIQPWFPWTTQGRMHDKYVIADDLAYILGGRNTFDYFIGDYETDDKSFDREMLIYNTRSRINAGTLPSEGDFADDASLDTGEGNSLTQSSLYEVEAYFNSVWNMDVCRPFHDDDALAQKEAVKEQRRLLEERYISLKANYPKLFESWDYEAVTKPTQGVHLLSGQTGIYGKEPRVFYMLSELMASAKDRVIIHTPYAVCNEYMYETLTELCRQVPEVTMMVNSVANGDNLVASSDYLKNKKHIVETGLNIYEYDGGNSYHGKSIVIDDHISIVGSYNLDLRSTYMDTELMLVVKSEPITEELTGYMEAMHKDCRRVINASEYETPQHLEIADIPFGKKVVFRLLGVLLAPFRCVI